MEEKFKGRLDSNVKPLDYRISISTNMESFVFDGEEEILLDVEKSMKSIMLNCSELKIWSVEVESKGLTQKPIFKIDKKTETLSLDLKKPIKGSAKLRIRFSGVNNDSMYGFYRSKYGNGEYLLSSQFEAVSARSAFPCFDEPSFKATFELSLTVDKDLEAVSNMPIASSVDIGGRRKRVTFKKTPLMATYLLYMGVGKFDHIEGSIGKIKFRVLTTPGKKKYGYLAFEYAKKFVKFYEDYFKVDYPLEKLDLIAAPDFAAGAMENWGAITFRETAMLGTEESSSLEKMDIAITVAHELAHMWFGDLVTMAWWDDLWLNESFATFMSYKAVSATFPSWKADLDFLVDNFGDAFAADQLKNTHPIHVDIKNRGDIESSFDSISYEKGCTVLFMIEDFIGKEIFRKGLHNYLVKHSYSNTKNNDLWDAIEETARKSGHYKPVAKVALAWITMPGYPVININHSNTELKQQRFFLLKNMKSSQTWPIPVHYSLDNGKSGFVLVQKKVERIPATDSSLLKLNYGQSGLYRVVYDNKMLEEIGASIKNRKLSDVDAWGISNDLFTLVRSGREKIDVYLDFVKCLYASGYPANISAMSSMGWLYGMVYGTNLEIAVKKEYFNYAKSVFERLGWNSKRNEDNHNKELRSAALSALGIMGYKPVVDHAKKLFDDRFDGKKLDMNIMRSVYSIVSWNFGNYGFGKLAELYQKSSYPEEKIAALASLSVQSSPAMIKKALELSLTEKIRLQDSYIIPAVVSGNIEGRKYIWEWTKQNWKTLMKKYNPSVHMLNRYAVNLSTQNSKNVRADIVKFFSGKGVLRSDVKKDYMQTLERIDANIAFFEANSKP